MVLDSRLEIDLLACSKILSERPSSSTAAPLPLIIWSQEGLNATPRADGLLIRTAQSEERLIDSISMALHTPVARLPEPHALMLDKVNDASVALAGKKVLIVDDDARNIFALATLLEDHGMDVRSASSGRDALKVLEEQTSLDIVLMDIMMPDMDGIATIRAARSIPACRELPFIAVTAKALKGDRERCIEAGAWDYLAKPVDAGSLLSVMRSWLYR
jgi:CheY-like chemotaxis protein